MTKTLSLSKTCLVAALAFLLLPALSQAAGYTYQTINDNKDPQFNQLLGINSSGEIAGYFGDGANLFNHGFTVVSPYAQANFTDENFPGASQTQVTGINSNSTPITVGFWGDTAGDNFGWYNNGTSFKQVVNPSTPTTGVMTNQLLGVNDSKNAVGFYVGSTANAHAYEYSISGNSFTAITPTGATSATATGIANNGAISGFFSDSTGTHGFIDISGTIKAYNDPMAGATGSTIFLGVNSNGMVVGNYTDSSPKHISHGLIFDYLTDTWGPINDPFESGMTAFMVQNTIANGINDAGDIVGFYSDGTNVDGFLATPTGVPEPASIGFTALAGLLFLGGSWRARRRKA